LQLDNRQACKNPQLNEPVQFPEQIQEFLNWLRSEKPYTIAYQFRRREPSIIEQGVTAPAPVTDGVNSAIVMDVVGHQSTAVSTHYTTIDSEAKRRAIERMPDILRPPRDPQDIFVHPIKFL
jgi:hypothetical protein